MSPLAEPDSPAVKITRVGDFALAWGESVRWDDRRQRLYFVDCATHQLHWLDGAVPPLQSLALPSMPTGVALCDDGRLIVALDDGLHVVDVDRGVTELLSAYPEEMGGRANDAAADLDGNLVTGSLNAHPLPGSYWWFSVTEGWRKLDEGITNANGPVVLDIDGVQTLVFADTFASALHAYDYDGRAGSVGPRRAFADTTEFNALPDGACGDDEGGVWSCLLGPGRIVRYTKDGAGVRLDVGVANPTDATFGGPDLDRLFFVSIGGSGGHDEKSANAGALMVVDGLAFRGRPEPRVALT